MVTIRNARRVSIGAAHPGDTRAPFEELAHYQPAEDAAFWRCVALALAAALLVTVGVLLWAWWTGGAA